MDVLELILVYQLHLKLTVYVTSKEAFPSSSLGDGCSIYFFGLVGQSSDEFQSLSGFSFGDHELSKRYIRATAVDFKSLPTLYNHHH